MDNTKLVILTRTTRRPNYFSGLVKSVANQINVKNIHLFVCYERDSDLPYVQSALKNYPNLKISLFQTSHKKWDKKERHERTVNYEQYSITYGLQNAPYNLHLNMLLEEAKNEYPNKLSEMAVVYLDDDDCFSKQGAAQIIVDEFEKNPDKVLMWLVDFKDKVIPQLEYWNKPPEIFHFSGIGFCHSLKYHDEAIWDDKTCSNYRVARKLVNKYGAIYIPDLLTKIQRKKAGLSGRMDDANEPLNKKQIFGYE